MKKVVVECNRCRKLVHGTQTKDFTSGFYNVAPGAAWSKYARNKNEWVVCDECMHKDPQYLRDYGPVNEVTVPTCALANAVTVTGGDPLWKRLFVFPVILAGLAVAGLALWGWQSLTRRPSREA